MSKNNEIRIGLFDELDSIYPDTNPYDGKEVYTVCTPSKCFAGVHIMIDGINAGETVEIEVKGPHTRYKNFELLAVPVENNSGINGRTERMDEIYNPYTIRKAPFMIYEVLKPIRNIIRSPWQSIALAFREFVEVEEFEQHKWEIYITVGKVTKKVIFIVNAYPLQVPSINEQKNMYINWICIKKIAQYHHVSMWSEEWEEIVLSYYKLAVQGRQNVAWIQSELFFDNKDGKLILNKKHLDRFIKIVKDTGIEHFHASNIARRKDGEWGATTGEAMITKQDIPGTGEEVIKNICKQLNTYILRNNMQDKWAQSFFDEPTRPSSDVYNLGVSIMKKNMPNIPVFEPNKATDLIEGSVDIWCPTLQDYQENKEFYDKRVTKGEKVWVYTCLEPTGPYLNRLLDMERMRTVLIGWASSLYELEGFLHWGGNMYRFNPYEQSCICMMKEDYTDYNLNYVGQLPAGDCNIFYPGYNGAISSTRLEGHRIGFEDLELIKILQQKDKIRAKEIVNKMIRNYKDYDTSIAHYRKVREELIKELI